MHAERFLRFGPAGFRGGAAAVIAALSLGFASSASGKDDPWLRVATPEFTLVTSLREKEAVVWAGEFSQYIAELRSLFNIKRALPPLTIVVFARDRAFEDYRPLGENGKPQPVAGFFLRHNSWAVAGLAGANATEEVRRVIFHEGVHWFLSALDRPNPVWVEEGLAEVFSTFGVTKNKVEWGRAIPEHVLLLSQEKLLPVDRLLYVGQSELFRDTSNHTGIVYAESWAAVHFLIYGDNKQIPRSALFDFLKLTNDGVPLEAAFRQAVGSDFATFDRRLSVYLRDGRYFIHSKTVVALAALRAEPAPAVEVAQALGRLALAGHRWEKAIAFARDSIAAAPDDPRGYELLGLARSDSGDDVGGREAFVTAVEKGSVDFQPYFSLAVGAQKAAVNDAGEPRELAPAEARRIADQYERAILLAPRFLPSYQNLAGVLAVAETRPYDREYLDLGRKIYPRDGWIRVGLSILTERGGDRLAALQAVNEIEADASEAGRIRAYARKLSDAWVRQEVLSRVDALAKEEKFPEALAYLEEQIAGPISSPLRAQLVSMRPGLKGAARSQEIGRAFKEQRFDEARQLLRETIASPELPVALKQQSQRALDDLDRRAASRRPAKK
jgi:tetratricopeptide (TPR) repeat protein